MLVNMMKSKIHRVTLTECILDYDGSITIDEDLLEKANMLPNEKVQVLNCNNGARLETYIIKGERGSGVICLNGPAARLGYVGDVLVVIAYCMMEEEQAKNYQPLVVKVDSKNKLI